MTKKELQDLVERVPRLRREVRDLLILAVDKGQDLEGLVKRLQDLLVKIIGPTNEKVIQAYLEDQMGHKAKPVETITVNGKTFSLDQLDQEIGKYRREKEVSFSLDKVDRQKARNKEYRRRLMSDPVKADLIRQGQKRKRELMKIAWEWKKQQAGCIDET